jgi:hypothetical protein
LFGGKVAGSLVRWLKSRTAVTAFGRFSSSMTVWLYLRFTLSYRYRY